ncbi:MULTISPECIES: restriction endonuclease subunit S [unclassified Shewanella]|uniref:restriction endonuclease subunit S n=1 Tax=unclassified Shewanella TaxID=196818 RepID=UPI001963A6D3|nr:MULTISPECIES: restriction endonuclease subunit S [unclassified Shewanella]
MSWPMVKIGSCIEKIKSWNPLKSADTDSFLYIDLSSVDKDKKEIDLSSVVSILPSDAPSRARQLVKANDVLVSTVRPNLNGVALVSESFCGATASTGYCVLRANVQKLDSRFLFYWVQTQSFISDMVKKATGANYPAVSDKIIMDSEIPLPPLAEQKRIAAILDKADAIRRKRQQAIQLADDFLRAVFLEMFGDPVTNPKGFPVGTIRDLVESASYGTSAKASVTEGAFPILRMGNITFYGEIDLSDLKFIDLSEKEQPKYLASKGDLLFNRTNSKELVGKTAVYDRGEPVAIAGYLVRVRANKLGNTHYISGYLNSQHGKATLQGMCKSIVGMANINAQEMQDISIMLPPIELQDKYKEIVLSVRDKTKVLEFSKEQQVALFNSLSQKAFSGQL